jgi:hypothetical protein
MTEGTQNNDALIARIKGMQIHPLIGQYVRLRAAGGGRHVGLCPFHDERTPSFNVDDRRGTFMCYGCGARGDAIDFLQRYHSLAWVDAFQEALAFYGLSALEPKLTHKPVSRPGIARQEDAEERIARETERARAMWKEAAKADGTLVETYLRGRAINPADLPGRVIPASIRFGAAVDYYFNENGRTRSLGKFPAMIAAIQNVAGRIVGAHITYLDPKTGSKLRLADPSQDGKFLPAKKMRGKAYGGAIRLAALGHHMQTAEGIENSLTAMAYHPYQLGAWAALSLQNLAGGGLQSAERVAHPERPGQFLPTTFPCPENPGFLFSTPPQQLTVIKDNDSKDWHTAERLFQRAARKFMARGTEKVFMATPPRGEDLNSTAMKAMR